MSVRLSAPRVSRSEQLSSATGLKQGIQLTINETCDTVSQNKSVLLLHFISIFHTAESCLTLNLNRLQARPLALCACLAILFREATGHRWCRESQEWTQHTMCPNGWINHGASTMGSLEAQLPSWAGTWPIAAPPTTVKIRRTKTKNLEKPERRECCGLHVLCP